MSLKISTDNISINQIVSQSNEKITVTGDEIVPDIKPDVLKIITTNGNVCIYKKEIFDGKIKIDGCICAYTLYLADDETTSIHSINSNINFSKIIDLDKVKSEMELKTSFELDSIECKILNGRKIRFDASINSYISVYANENISIVNGTEEINDIQKLETSYNINSIVGVKNTRVYAKDTININEEDNLKDIIKLDINVSNIENKINYNKILTKADANIRILYLTDDNKINSVTSVIPVMGFVDMENINEEDNCETLYELKNLVVKPNTVEEHSVYIEAEFETNINITNNRQMNIIEDLYSPSTLLNYDKKDIKIMRDVTNIEQTFNFRKQEVLAEIGKGKIYDSEVRAKIINTQVSDGTINYEGEIEIILIYEEQESRIINSKTIIEPFNYSINDSKLSHLSSIQTEVSIKNKDFIVMTDDSLDIKIDITFGLKIIDICSLNVITSMDRIDDTPRNRCSMVIYYVKQGDTLWKIAKKFGSTIEEIKIANSIENENEIFPGDQLFIPR